MRKKIILTIIRQHKAFYCYLLLSLWIFLIVVGLYRYLAINSLKKNAYKTSISAKIVPPDLQRKNETWPDNKLQKLLKSCALTPSIIIGGEGKVPDEFSLEGVVVIFRHGDRGPINHVRNLDSISCSFNDGANDTKIFNEYMSYIFTHWSSQSTNNLYQYYNQQNYHPPTPRIKQCEIGQLSFQGVLQHLKLGHILRNIYFDKLLGNSTQISSNIFAYTTKYRRTFQSLNAFLYGFLKEKFRKIMLYFANSMYFCFEDCACPATNFYDKAVISENIVRRKSHPAIIKLVEEIASIVYTMSDNSFVKDPHYIKDALLTYICHNSHLPCDMTKCVQPDHVIRIFSYIDWDIRQMVKSTQRHKLSLLNAYGFFKSITNHLLKMVSNEKPKIVLYSTHDKTLQHLLTAIGVTSNESVYPIYASRIIFEVYSPKQIDGTTKKFFFRVLFNGKDVTHRIKFCNNKKRLMFGKNNMKSVLCSFESLIRFLHDDYFSTLNAVNFKEACAFTKN